MSEPTPGPWYTDGAEIFTGDDTWVAESLDTDDPGRGEANARLIAAGPDLLAAAIGVLKDLDSTLDTAQPGLYLALDALAAAVRLVSHPRAR